MSAHVRKSTPAAAAAAILALICIPGSTAFAADPVHAVEATLATTAVKSIATSASRDVVSANGTDASTISVVLLDAAGIPIGEDHDVSIVTSRGTLGAVERVDDTYQAVVTSTTAGLATLNAVVDDVWMHQPTATVMFVAGEVSTSSR
jgi:hypothetical protein